MKELDKHFKNQLSGFTELPRQEVWEGIEAQLDALDTKKPLAWWRTPLMAVSGAAAAVALAIILWPAKPSIDATFDTGAHELSGETETNHDGDPMSTKMEEESADFSGESVTPQKIVTAQNKKHQAPFWETLLEEEELAWRDERELSAIEPVRSELITEPVVVEVVFSTKDLTPEAEGLAVENDIKNEKWSVSSALGATARALTKNTSNSFSKGMIKWNEAREELNQTFAQIERPLILKNPNK